MGKAGTWGARWNLETGSGWSEYSPREDTTDQSHTAESSIHTQKTTNVEMKEALVVTHDLTVTVWRIPQVPSKFLCIANKELHSVYPVLKEHLTEKSQTEDLSQDRQQKGPKEGHVYFGLESHRNGPRVAPKLKWAG